MSSVQRFLKQIPASDSQFTKVVVSSMYVFTPAAGNVVGNYPPGTLTQLTSGVVFDAVTAARGEGTCVMRDMGKTIYAPIAGGSNAAGYFRQVQLLVPAHLSAGFIGGSTGSAFGVQGVAANNYCVVYVPVAVNGLIAQTAAFTGVPLSAGSL